MSEMVERVGRAIDPYQWAALDAGRVGRADHAREDLLKRARAAIEAMREPTELMGSLGGAICAPPEREDAGTLDTITAMATWRTMIDAALLATPQAA